MQYGQTVAQPQVSPFMIPYAPVPEEGECTLISIEGLRKITWRFVLFILISIIFAGLPALLAFWFIRFRRWLYYSFSPMDQATHFFILNYDKKYTIVSKKIGPLALSDRQQINAIYFVNRYLKYYFNPNLYAFQALTFNYIPRLTDYFRQQNSISGYDNQLAYGLHQTYGYCVMELPRPGCFKLLILEVLQPFYLFIVYSVILWYYQKYIYYASIILGTTIISLLINLYMVYKLNNKIYKMAYYVTPIHIIRNGQVMELPSPEIVPGDIVMLKRSIKLPFDGILLSGSLLINESALTGESVPVVKKAIEGHNLTAAGVTDKSSMLYEGTELIQICSYGSQPFHQNLKMYGVMALVTRTSFTTVKGQLIRIISFPKDRKVRFYWQAAKFILFLFILSIVSYIVLIIKLRKNVEGKDLALKFFDLITITVPPGLPASMSIGIIYCLWRMERMKIYCISPGKIIPGGRVEHICFDKTGTLTDQFMDFHEFVPVANGSFGNPIRLAGRTDQNNRQIMASQQSIEAMNAMATCHSIMNLEGTQKLIGDPMEIKLFEFGQNKLAGSSQVFGNYRESLFSYAGPFSSGTVFRRFEFNSDLQRMSVLASTSTNPQAANVYCKGAPESMTSIMNPNGLPRQYNQILQKYTACGFRVLALASKPIQVSQIGTMSRQAAERGLNFNGFVVFQNKLKPQTKAAIYELKQAQISVVIITGDNALTGANIGFKSGIIQPYYNAMIIDLDQNNQIKVTNFNEQMDETQEPPYIQQNGYIYQNPLASEQRIIQMYQKSKVKTQRDFVCTIQELPRRAIEIGSRGRTVFVLTGPAFQKIFTEPLTEEKKYLMYYIRVFARTKPNDKTKAISIYQQMGLIVGMCGDGANDCGALKQADAGLSLSEAQASISAPFTSKIPNITSMVELIKQCRGGLATNFSLFNIMALYSLIQYTTTVTTQWFYGYPADLQYLYWDLFCNFFFFLTLGFTPPARRLSVLRPSDSLFSVGNLTSVLLLFGIQMFGQFLVIILMSKSKFATILNYWQNAGEQVNLETYRANQNDFSLETYEVQSLFLFSNFLYLFTVLAFTIDRPWRRHFIFNPFFVIIFLFVFIYSFLIVVVPRARIKGFNLITFDARWQWLLLGMGLAFGIFMYLLQKCVLQPCFNALRLRNPKKQWL